MNNNQGLQYIKLRENFASQIGAPETTRVNDEDITHLEELKDKFLAAVSDYSEIRKTIAENATNYVGLMTKSSKEYEDYINRNVKLIDGSKYYITNSGVAKKYASESSWNNRHSSCKKVSDDPYELSVQNESGLQTNKPSLVLGTPMKEGEPCGKGYENIKVNIPIHGDPILKGCYYNSSADKKDRNVIVTKGAALKPDTNESIIGENQTFEECRIEALKRLKKFFSLTSVDENNKGTCTASNDTTDKKYARFGQALDSNDSIQCKSKDSSGYFLGKPQKCITITDVCQPRKYEQIDDFYDCDVDDTFGNSSRAWTASSKTNRGATSVYPEKFYMKVTIKSNNSRWAASGQIQHLKVAYDNNQEKFSKAIPFSYSIPMNGTVSETIEVPFDRATSKIYGISLFVGRDSIDADWIKIQVSFDNQKWSNVGGDSDGKMWGAQFFTKYNDYFTIRSDMEYSLDSILPTGFQIGMEDGKNLSNVSWWRPLEATGKYYLTINDGIDKLINAIVIKGNVSQFKLSYKNLVSGTKYITYKGNNGTDPKILKPQYTNNAENVMYLDFPIMMNTIELSDMVTLDGTRAKIKVDVVGMDLKARDNKVKFEGYYSMSGSNSIALSTNGGEKTFEECIVEATRKDIKYFGVYGYNTDTQKVNCYFPSENKANPSANAFYMSDYNQTRKKVAKPVKYSGNNGGFELGNDNKNVAIYTMTGMNCKKRPKDGKPISCPTNTKYYSATQGLTDQCCTEKEDCDAGYSTVYNTNITDTSTMGNTGYVDRDNILHPYAGMKIDENDDSCPKTEVSSITGELWSKFNMGQNMTKEKTCGIAQLSPNEKMELQKAESNLRDIATNIDNKIESAYEQNFKLNNKKQENEIEFSNNFNEYTKQYKKVKSEYSKKIQTMYEDLELKTSGDFIKMAGIAVITGVVIGGGIYYMKKSKSKSKS